MIRDPRRFPRAAQTKKTAITSAAETAVLPEWIATWRIHTVSSVSTEKPETAHNNAHAKILLRWKRVETISEWDDINLGDNLTI